MKLTPLKRLHKNDSRMASPSVQSPGGPYAVRTSNFQLVGFTHLNISTFTRNAWTLEKVGAMHLFCSACSVCFSFSVQYFKEWEFDVSRSCFWF